MFVESKNERNWDCVMYVFFYFSLNLCLLYFPKVLVHNSLKFLNKKKDVVFHHNLRSTTLKDKGWDGIFT